MLTQNIVVNRHEALLLFRKYREHRHYSTPIDWEIQRTYQLISQGRLIIKALASVTAAGLGDDGLPKLAIGRANAPKCVLQYKRDGSVRFASNFWLHSNNRRDRIDLPAGSFPRQPQLRSAEAAVPLIPIHLRPKRGLANYHLLWEAIWRPMPPHDPMLLRRIGQADLWLVVAAWDLTEVERTALATRM
jgi:hypothetical protein